MLKIVTHQALQRAVLVTIFHPLSLSCRTSMLAEIEALKGSAAGVGVAPPPLVKTDALGGGGDVSGLLKPTWGSSDSIHSIGSNGGSGITAAAGGAAAAGGGGGETKVAGGASSGNGSVQVALGSNIVKDAWDRLHLEDCPKITLLVTYIEHILLQRIVATATDDAFAGGTGVEDLVSHEVDEDYLRDDVATTAVTPLRTVSDPSFDSIEMLLALCLLPPQEYCEEQCAVAKSRSVLALHLAAAASAVATTASSTSSSSAGAVSAQLLSSSSAGASASASAAATAPVPGSTPSMSLPPSGLSRHGSKQHLLQSPDGVGVGMGAGMGVGVVGCSLAHATSSSSMTGGEVWSSEMNFDETASTDTYVPGGYLSQSSSIAADLHAEGEPGNSGNTVSFAVEGIAEVEEEESSDSKSRRRDDTERGGRNEAFSTPLPFAAAAEKKKKRDRLGRNDMLLPPAESTMGVGLNSADQLAVPALKKLAEAMQAKLPMYPRMRLFYSIEPVFVLLSNAQNYSITAVQVCFLYL
jgi:hypothetical protein